MNNSELVQNNLKVMFPAEHLTSEILQHIQDVAAYALDLIVQQPWNETKIIKELAAQFKTKAEHQCAIVAMGYTHSQAAEKLGIDRSLIGGGITNVKRKVAAEKTSNINLQYKQDSIPQFSNTFFVDKEKDSRGYYLTIETPSKEKITSRNFSDYATLDALFNGRDNWVQLVQQWNLEADNDSELAASIYA